MVPTGASTYTYSNGSSVDTPTTNTTYSVSGTGINGCVSAIDAISSVTVNALPTIIVNSGAICAGQSFTMVPTGASTYTYSNGSSVDTPTTNTTYSVSGTGINGCVSAIAAISSVTVNSYPTVTIGADVEVSLGGNYQFNPIQVGASTYAWSPSDYLSSGNIINPSTTPQNDISYILTVTSANGCIASDTINVKVLRDLIIANYMSPNGDGVNDTWQLNVPALIKDYSVDIIDSYGQTVYVKSNNYNNDFDGKLGGNDLPDGVYYYFIKDGSAVKYKGSITVIK
jgi:gliding motility-associated-like protein